MNGAEVLAEDMRELRAIWEETSYRLERLQMNPDCAEAERRAIHDRTGPTYHLPFAPQPTAPAVLASARKPKVAILREEGSNSDREMAGAFHAAGFEPWDVTMTDLLAGRVSLEGFRGLAAVGGFSYADVPESAKGWAATIRFNERLAAMFDAFYGREDTFSLGICNGCQLFGLLGWVPWRGIAPEMQPRFVHNTSGRFESRWSTVRVLPSRSVLLRGMEGLVFGIPVAHGEGRLIFPDAAMRSEGARRGPRGGRLRGRRRPPDRAVPLQPERLPRRDHRPDDPGRPPPRDDAPPRALLPPLAGALAARAPASHAHRLAVAEDLPECAGVVRSALREAVSRCYREDVRVGSRKSEM